MEKAEYLDVEILRERTEKLKKQYSTIETGIYINGEIMGFERIKVLDSLSAMTPKEEFALMSEDLARIKYPHTFRPACIFSNQDLTICLTFNKLPTRPYELTLKQATENMKETLENEKGVFNLGEVESLNNIEGHYFEFNQKVIDGELHHMMANIKLNENIYQLTFNCLSSQTEWKRAVIPIWESVEHITN